MMEFLNQKETANISPDIILLSMCPYSLDQVCTSDKNGFCCSVV